MKSISRVDPIATVDYLCNHPEGLFLERKGIDEKGVKPSKLADEIIGMLNADGGIIVLGISDEGAIQDLNEMDTELLRRYEKVCHEFIMPPAHVEIEKVTFPDGELVFLYHVFPTYENMYSRNDKGVEKVYKRIVDSNSGPLSNDEIEKLRHDKFLRKYEEQICIDFSETDLDASMLERYKSHLKYDGDASELLEKRGLVKMERGKIKYKYACVLLFAEDPSKYISSASLRYVRYDGRAPKAGVHYNVIKDERFEGNIPTIIDNIKRFMAGALDDFYYLEMKSGRFKKISEYPEGAWLEGVVNALFHRSYNLDGDCVMIKHYDDRLEISNSGPLPAQVTVHNIRKKRYSRNPRLGRVLSDMGYVRELNEGVNRIYESMEESMLSQPKYIDEDDTVTLFLENTVAPNERSIAEEVLVGISEKWESYNDTQRKIFQCLFNNNQATIKQLAEYCDVTEQAARPYINGFIKQGILIKDTDKLRDKNASFKFRKRAELFKENS